MMLPSNRLGYLVLTQPVDFRKGYYGLAVLVSSVLRKDPLCGTVFMFRPRWWADRLKLLFCDGLRTAGGCDLLMALDLGWSDGAETCPV
jgi:transposase